MHRFILACVSLLALSGCAGSLPGESHQGDAGMTVAKAEFKDVCSGPAVHECLKYVEISDGKASADMAFSVNPTDGEISFRRSGTTVDGQAVRAAVEVAVAQQIGAVAPGVVDAIVRAVMTSIIPIPSLP